jgi:alpha/beta superfamily hydrolase
VREEAQRIDARLEGTLRIPDGPARAIVVVAHPLPTHGGEMRNPLVAGIARACAERGWYALRFNFRGVGGSSGTWSGGRDEALDVAAAVAHARASAPGLPLGLVGYSFGALMSLRWLSRGGQTDALVLVGFRCGRSTEVTTTSHPCRTAPSSSRRSATSSARPRSFVRGSHART